MVKKLEIVTLYEAPPLAPDSWLNDEHYADFRRRYEYAMTQTMAIEPLAKLSPEEVYWLWFILDNVPPDANTPACPSSGTDRRRP